MVFFPEPVRTQLIEEVGAKVEEAWRDIDYEPKAFPELAVAALSEARLSEKLTPDDIVDWVFTGQELPHQADPTGMFGQPPVTVYRGRRFYIDTLFWVDGTTAVHQHAFSGAFCVLAGSSIETRFHFDLGRDIDGLFQIGKLQVVSTALLRPGDVRPIASGPRLIHSLFHLERPSSTVVIRTYRDAAAGPQFDYSRPGIGHDPFFQDPTLDRTLHLVKMLRTVEHPRFEQLVGDLVARSDLHTAYRILRDCLSLQDRELVDRLVRRLRDVDLAESVRQSFEQTRRLSFLHSRRGLVKDPELRFFLGVLLNAQRRTDVMDLVLAREPNVVPGRTIAGWLRRLSNITAKLQAGGAAWEPNLLGLPTFTDQLEADLEAVLDGRPVGVGEQTATFIDRLHMLPALSSLWT